MDIKTITISATNPSKNMTAYGDFMKTFDSGFGGFPSYYDLYRTKQKKPNPHDVKSIKFDKKFTTVTWADGTTTRVGCMLEDEYNRYEAFCAALGKKIYKTTSAVKHIVDTKDEQIEIDKQRREREESEKAAQIRKARKDRIWIKRRAKEIALENAAQELANKFSAK